MSEVSIKFENISKQYRLGIVSTKTLSHDLNRWWQMNILQKEDPYLKIGESNDRSKKGSSEYVWALQNIDFEVRQGEILGIIGKNGAGKSTLLKILSRVTAPTTGSIKAKGRIASLLEVGTGFHPELTGRENVYMNGCIMGMTRSEIDRKFDEIVDFAGVERYIDTPVKRYSSGMMVRLGFSIAAHLEPEILVVDEVLAVGDAEFQKKAIGKMQDVSRSDGRTVLFVSHNMAAIKSLCNTGYVLKNGCYDFSGTAMDAVIHYQNSHNTNMSYQHEGSIETALGNENIRILKFDVRPLNGEIISISSGIVFELTFYNEKINTNLDATFELKTIEEVMVYHGGVLLSQNNDSRKGVYTVKGTLPPHLLNAGNYIFNLIFGENQRYLLFGIKDFIGFEVQNESHGTNSNIMPGVIHPNINYDIIFQ